jgi:hypothetical protein
MTTIALNYSQNLLNWVNGVAKKTFQGMMIGYIMARQTQANSHIARLMIHEYREEGHTVESLTHELNVKSLQRIRKEYNIG